MIPLNLKIAVAFSLNSPKWRMKRTTRHWQTGAVTNGVLSRDRRDERGGGRESQGVYAETIQMQKAGMNKGMKKEQWIY